MSPLSPSLSRGPSLSAHTGISSWWGISWLEFSSLSYRQPALLPSLALDLDAEGRGGEEEEKGVEEQVKVREGRVDGHWLFSLSLTPS